MRPVDWNELVKLCEAEGCRFDRQRGDHYVMVKPGLNRPVVFPKKRGLREDIVLGVGRTLGLTKRQIEERVSIHEISAPRNRHRARQTATELYLRLLLFPVKATAHR